MTTSRDLLLAIAASALPALGHAYEATALVTMEFGGNAGQAGSPDIGAALPQTPLADIGWTGGVNELSTLSDEVYFSTLGGYVLRSYYDADFATAEQCAAIAAGLGGTGGDARKYGCRYTDSDETPTFTGTPVTDFGAGGRATGRLTVTDTTLTGTLTVVPTTDEPTGATVTVTPTGARISNSIGDGATGFNYRSLDGYPFGNRWQGVSAGATFEVNLTGVFTQDAWQITGGTVRLADPGYTCQQGGFGGSSDTQAGTHCTRSTLAGGVQYDGAHLSFGWDPDGASTGTTTTEITVRDGAGTTVLATLSGVRAQLAVTDGELTTVQGEFRRGVASGVCGDHLRWDGTRISCGTLVTGGWRLTGSVELGLQSPDAADDVAVGYGVETTPIAVLANDRGFGQSGAVAVTLDSPPLHGTATIVGSPGAPGDIRIDYRSDPGYTGADSFIYTASDAGGSDPAMVTVTVNPATAFNDAATTTFERVLAIPVAANDRGFDETVTVTLDSQPFRGSAVVQGSPGPRDGISVVFTPESGQTGIERFNYSISDGTVADTASVAVTVQATAQDDSATVTQGQAVVLAVLTNDIGFVSPVTVLVSQAPLHGTAVVSGSPGPRSGVRITYTPDPGYVGPDSFVYFADDDTALDSATVTIDVVGDRDGDGVADSGDNCVAAANADQRDTDGDGFGNRCDADLNGNGMVNAADLALFRVAFGSDDPHADFDGNGAVNATDLAILRTLFGRPPGPAATAAQ